MKKILYFIKKETVLSIAVVLAVISVFFVVPDREYISYIDFRTLAILFCLMSIVAGLRNIDVFDKLAERLLAKVHGIGGVTSTAELQEEAVSALPGTYPIDMIFSSGAGGWSTTLTLSQDGSFTGAFSDSEMGERDENEYPNGTVYVCNFSGQFKDIKKVNDYTYSMTLDSVKVAEDEEKIEDGIRYKAGEPSGMDSGTEIYFYTPDAPVSELPEAFLSWWQESADGSATLDCYAIYNKSADSGFFEYAK